MKYSCRLESPAHGWRQETVGSPERDAEIPHILHRPLLLGPMSEMTASTVRPMASDLVMMSKATSFSVAGNTESPEMTCSLLLAVALFCISVLWSTRDYMPVKWYPTVCFHLDDSPASIKTSP